MKEHHEDRTNYFQYHKVSRRTTDTRPNLFVKDFSLSCFKITRKDLQMAIEKYLTDGGTIKKSEGDSI